MGRKHTPPSFQEEDDPFAFLWPGLNTAPIRARIRARVSGVNLPGWREQADDLVEDIFQEAVIRAFQQTQPIRNIGAFLTTVADHYFDDLYRQAKSELRLVETLGRAQLGEEETNFEQRLQASLEPSRDYHDYGFAIDSETCTLYMFPFNNESEVYIFDDEDTPDGYDFDDELDEDDEIETSQSVSASAISFPQAKLGYVQETVHRICWDMPLLKERDYRKAQRAVTSELTRIFGPALPEPCQSVLRLYYLDRHTLGEIAAQMQLPLGTVKSHINRGVKQLHRLRDQGEGQQQKQETNAQHNPIQQQDQVELVTRIHALPERYQVAVRLHYIERRTYPEIACELGLPLGTVKSLVSRGMKLLRELREAA